MRRGSWARGALAVAENARVHAGAALVLSADCMRSPIECGNDWK
jgi:hypothetical protein